MSAQGSDVLPAERLKRTTSRCPVCRVPCPGEVWRIGTNPGEVQLKRTCPTHGEFSACLASDARFYWLARGNPRNADTGLGAAGGCCEPGSACCAADGSNAGSLGRNARSAAGTPGSGASFETLSTCLALIEIVQSCNLSCPTCYADSPRRDERVDAVPLADVQRRVQGVIDRKGGIEILQLSGGEPTLHPELFALLEWARAHPKIDYLLLNTNGVRLAHDAGFAERLGAIFAQGGLQVYLQFDGLQAAGQHELRGADLRATRQRVIERCAAARLPVTLAMTVTAETIAGVWDTIAFGLRHPCVHGVTFQPMFGSGRIPAGAATGARTMTRLNTADILKAAVEGSRGRLRFEDFTPLPCGDPNCATIGYLIRDGERVRSISEFVDFRRLQGFLRDKVRYTVADLARCGCENQPLGELLKSLETGTAEAPPKASATFRIMVKPFMDAWSWDQDRIDRCCTHVIRPDGSLDSFCRYYAAFPDAAAGVMSV